MKKFILFVFLFSISFSIKAQENPELGAWYMYFGNLRFRDSPWAIHGEIQYRNHNIIGDLEQLLLRTGMQYNLTDGKASFLIGYGNITTDIPGEVSDPFSENRLYQEAILRQNVGRVGIMHRYRYEQRWTESIEFRTRFRYAIFINIPLNTKELSEKGSWYIQLYDELFINGETLDGKVSYFDRNRLYLGLGKRLNSNLAIQFGFMDQKFNQGSKAQLQFSAFHQLYNRK
ncbi:DUF2490 domain-containing protein [Algoriphagus sp. PAP.12]|uniref:DUF2490 domain-containing protein n=1 Tax=Algoriphagus sp. PAP.12 TaxID=2996678 RepID=UPI00227AE130|nr:DUF2490 domain-containing protein [Algoriphagus sp. PAP.12]